MKNQVNVLLVIIINFLTVLLRFHCIENNKIFQIISMKSVLFKKYLEMFNEKTNRKHYKCFCFFNNRKFGKT